MFICKKLRHTLGGGRKIDILGVCKSNGRFVLKVRRDNRRWITEEEMLVTGGTTRAEGK